MKAIMTKKKTIKKIHLGLLFFAGLSLFIFGIIGYVLRLFTWVPVSIDEVLPQKTSLLVKVQLDQIQDQQDVLNLSEFTNRLDLYLGKKFNINFSEKIKPWIGKKASFAILDNGEQVWALEYRNKKEALVFLRNFTTPKENFITQDYSEGELLTPEFSSNITFGFYHNWLVISQDRAAIMHIFTKENSLKKNESYKKIITDIPRENFLFVFSETAKTIDHVKLPEAYIKYKLLLTTLSQSLSALGFAVQQTDGQVILSTKILANEDIFDDREIPKIPNKNMPRLASMISADTLFFTNGADLYAKYLHTKKFLDTLEPQFAIIFDGLLKAQAEKIFGQNFNFELDFLVKMRGQYAFSLDIEDSAKPFVNFIFISNFGDKDGAQSISKIHEAIRLAQTQSTPIIEEIKLPNGSIRKELVTAKAKDILITKNTFESRDYFTTPQNNTHQSFTYGFIDDNFVLSTQESGVKSVISVLEKKKTSLTENHNFRESVLFKFSPSQSYGFLNFIKFNALVNLWKEESSDSFSRFLSSKFKELTFSRKVFPGEIFIKVILFEN